MSTIAQLPAGWCVKDEGRDERVEENAVFGTIVWEGPWATRADFLAIAGGLPETIAYPGGSATRIIPLKYPGPFENVYAYSISGQPFGRISADANEGGTWTRCKLTVQFRSWQYQITGTDYPLMTLNADSSADMITIPGTAYEFPSDSLRLDRNVGIPVTTLDFSLTFHQLPTINMGLYDSMSGRVNSTAFVVGGYSFGAGYVQYIGPSSTSTLKVGNVFNHVVTHKFRSRRIKHNEIMRPDGTGFEAPERIGSSDKLLPEADLNLLFLN
jgi:hypothetical protein